MARTWDCGMYQLASFPSIYSQNSVRCPNCFQKDNLTCFFQMRLLPRPSISLPDTSAFLSCCDRFTIPTDELSVLFYVTALLPSLSGRSCKGFMHMKFTQTADGRYVLGENSPPFSTIPEVIHYYTTHKLPIRGAEHMSLLYPVIVQTLWHWYTHTLFLLVLLNTIYTQYLPFSAPFLSYMPFHCRSTCTAYNRLDCLVPLFSIYHNPSNYTGSLIRELSASSWTFACELVSSLKSLYFNTMDSWKSAIIDIKFGSWVLLGKR